MSKTLVNKGTKEGYVNLSLSGMLTSLQMRSLPLDDKMQACTEHLNVLHMPCSDEISDVITITYNDLYIFTISQSIVLLNF